MALLYHRTKLDIEDHDVDIRVLEDNEDYAVAITFSGIDEDDITEVLLTKEEVQYAHDTLFNK